MPCTHLRIFGQRNGEQIATPIDLFEILNQTAKWELLSIKVVHVMNRVTKQQIEQSGYRCTAFRQRVRVALK